ncbi:MAG: hypothetical protein KDA90_19285 [Planctomycetaceae bacterium]|nr:hypothetical protein [Planctomycetaceae bacterium]
MQELIDLLVENAKEHYLKAVLAGAGMCIGWIIGRWRARRNWERREFYDRLNVSLNLISDNTLLIRTLLEKRCEEIFLNTAASKTVIDAARNTTLQDCLLPLKKEDYWYYLNAVLNEISEKFAEGPMLRAMGQQVQCQKFTICLTSEADGNLRMRKVRAMVIGETLLSNLPEEPPRFESPHHDTRWKTLKQLAAARTKSPEKFLTVELCFPLPSPRT